MGNHGSHGPQPFQQKRVSTPFVRVPWIDWNMVRLGRKREFRSHPGGSSLKYARTPCPAVAYTWHLSQGYESELMVVEACWQEPLGAISAESLENEGFETFAEFRSYWCQREKRKFSPLKKTTVFRIRPFEEDDEEEFSRKIFQHLFGEFIDGKRVPATGARS